MSLQPVLIAGRWQQSRDPVGAFSAVNPATKRQLSEEFPISSLEEVQSAIQAGQEAVVEMRSITAEQSAQFLEAFANNIERRAEALVEIANLETALPADPRLRTIELPRNQSTEAPFSQATVCQHGG
jgi:NADP-dependent aldehyde dehydrogenase